MSFIEKVVKDLLEKKIDLSKAHIILPGKRPVIFFKKAFLDAGYEGFIPMFSSIEDFIQQYSSLIKTDNIPLWLESFKIQKKYINPAETLEDFLKWIPTLLKDFDDIDIHSEDPYKVLNYLTSIERIENWGETLDSENEGKLYYKNVKFWENNVILYRELIKSLKEQGMGTQGMILNSVLENLKNIQFKEGETYIFIGLNAITPKEEKIIKYFISHTNTFLYWDTDEYYMKNTQQEAGQFLRNNIQWNYYANRDFLWQENKFSQFKNIKVISASQEVAQVKYAGNLLAGMSEEELQNTALVLCDETILSSVMESLPENVKKVNITMGYPLKNSVLASFFKHIFQLHIFREKNDSNGFYYHDVLKVLTHPLVEKTEEIINFVNLIHNNNLVFISNSLLYEKLYNWSMLFLFQEYKSPVDILRKIQQYCTIKFWDLDETEAILKESFLKFKGIFSVLITQLSEENLITDFSLLHIFYQHILLNEKIDFIGEPLGGLQMMGVLETRVLGFKNIMLSVNEGILPVGKTENSFIPFDVKKNYQINTFLENDAIYAYHFYRLLQHAENIDLLYNNFSEGTYSGEKSRFIRQLEFESGQDIKEIVISYSGGLQNQQEISIKKTPELINRVYQWLEKFVSPTHLTNYHYNPINFYLQKILDIENTQEVEEEISPLSYGNLIHHTLEALYAPLKNTYLTEEELMKMQSVYQSKLKEYIQENLNEELFDRGQNYLQKLLAEKTVEKIILKDLEDVRKGNTIYLKDIEKEINSAVLVDEIGIVNLRGFIDRWDVFNGINRIIDYKTSSVGKLNFSSENYHKLQEHKDFKFFIQLVFYAYMVLNEKYAEFVQVGIWSFKKPFKGVEFLQYDKNVQFSYYDTMQLFEKVTEIIKEIANPEIPFTSKI